MKISIFCIFLVFFQPLQLFPGNADLKTIGDIRPFSVFFETDDELFREVLWSKIANSKPPERPKIGIALSGGGARGFAHAGVLEVLNYSGFPVDFVSGTSMGAVVGGLYSLGMSVEDIRKFSKKTASLRVSRDFRGIKFISLLISDKLLSPTYITQFIETNFGNAEFESLKKPFACVAMDLKTGEKIIFREGPVAAAVRASVNLPGIFAPVEYRHRYLVDGGVVDFIPVDAAKLLGAEWILSSVTEGEVRDIPDNVFMALLQVIDIRGAMLAKAAEKESDFIVKPNVKDIKVADFERCEEAGERGIMETARIINKAKESLIIYWFAKKSAEKL
ncbi:MAG: patatin-like phospholipase family protein [Elusimicrobia bacterium]|nr:patatin-like phospholipase family protein [Elusimicrobiota bacterium]